MTPTTFSKVCDALGGQRVVAELAGTDDRTVRHWAKGTRKIPARVPKLLIRALYNHAETCRDLARALKL